MSRLFYIDNEGNFRISATQLTYTQSPYKNGTYYVPVRLIDLQGNSQSVKIIVQVSSTLNQVQCPKINENVDCRYTVNRTVFLPSLNSCFYIAKYFDERFIIMFFSDQVRFCFYGANPTVLSFNTNSDPYYSQVYYALLPGSPNFLYINPYDGCVKIMPWFNKEEASYISFKVLLIYIFKKKF